jgi:three-Cys-motif partner protein
MSRKGNFGGDWTREKLGMLRDYLGAYTTILKEHPFEYAYIDAFAGSGYCRKDPEEVKQETMLLEFAEKQTQDFIKGSARVALEVDPEFSQYIFIEENEGAAEDLRELREEFPDKASRITEEDANDWLQNAADKNWNPKGKRSRRAIVFLDPYGMQVEWSTIEALADTKAVDLWILFPLGVAVNRLLRKNGEIPESLREQLTRLFGTKEWEERFYDKSPDLFDSEKKKKTADFDSIAEFFNERLESSFVQVAPNPRKLYNSRGNPLYLLCFAASNPGAAPTAVGIAEYILDP